MEEYTVVWKWVEKILQCHYTLCQVYLFSREPLCSNCFCFWFFCVCVFLFFLFDLESRKMAVELSFGSSVRVLKLDGCTNKSVSVSYLCLSILSWHTVRCAAIPPWKLWFIRGGTVLTQYRRGSCWWEMIDNWESQALQNPPDYSRLQAWNNAIQSWEPLPWKHMLRKGHSVLQEKKMRT